MAQSYIKQSPRISLYRVLVNDSRTFWTHLSLCLCLSVVFRTKAQGETAYSVYHKIANAVTAAAPLSNLSVSSNGLTITASSHHHLSSKHGSKGAFLQLFNFPRKLQYVQQLSQTHSKCIYPMPELYNRNIKGAGTTSVNLFPVTQAISFLRRLWFPTAKPQLHPLEFDSSDYQFFHQIGVPHTSSLPEIEDAYSQAIHAILDPKERLLLKDKWIDISQKILRYELDLFSGYRNAHASRQNSLKEPLSEFSSDFLKTVDWPQSTKDKIISRRQQNILGISKLGRVKGGLFQRPTAITIRSISKYFIPVTIFGGIIPKLSAPSIAICTMLTAGIISSKDKPEPKKDEFGKPVVTTSPNLTTVGLTLFLIAIHESLGAGLAALFLRLVELPALLAPEGVVAIFINLQLLFAALHYKTFIADSEGSTDD